MSNNGGPAPVANLKAPPIYKVIVSQLCTSVIAALVVLLLLNGVAAYSVLLGGLICAVPNGYLARKAFQHRGARFAPQIVKSFYLGQAVRWIMTVALLGLVFTMVEPLNAVALFAGFVITQLAGIVALARIQAWPRQWR